jgi:HAD superfamily phosphoserine phosphatase-like hydrolase
MWPKSRLKMSKPTIVWDFDGTILPSVPYDSEQTLLLHLLRQPGAEIPLRKKIMGWIALLGDRHELFPRLFKRVYVRLLAGAPVSVLDDVCNNLARRISAQDRSVFSKLKEHGFPMIIVSCGTRDLITRVLRAAGIEECFQRIEGNRFRIEGGHIDGFESSIADPAAKVRVLAESCGLASSQVVAVGDGYTDMPLLDWAGVSVLIDRSGKKGGRMRRYRTIASALEILEILE